MQSNLWLLAVATLAMPLGVGQVSAQSAAKPDMTPLAVTVDVNKDGKLTRAEWVAAGLPMPPFENLAAGRDFITPDDLAKSNVPADIDANKDGKVTAAELIAYGKARAANPPKDRPPLPGAGQ